MTQQMTRTIYNPKLTAVFERLKKFKLPIRLQGSFHLIRETVEIEAIIVSPNFHVNMSFSELVILKTVKPGVHLIVTIAEKSVSDHSD